MDRCRRCDFQATAHDELAEHAQDAIHPLCICCARSLDEDSRQTCIWCLGRARRDLITIVELCALLPDQALNGGGATTLQPITGSRETAMPGGDALVLLAPGNLRGSDSLVERDDDPQPPLALLATWEDALREDLGLPAAGPATLASVSEFLSERLGWLAANHPAFDSLADDLSKCRGRLESVLRAGDRPLRAPAPCFDCGGDLLRIYADPHPCPHENAPCGCDQGGLSSHWECRRCHRTYDDASYWLALRAELDKEEAS